MTTRHNIDTCAVLVEFNASVWTARKLDKGTTEEVVHNKNAAAHDAVRVNKHLLAGRSELEKIISFVSMVRNWVNERTIPWADSGIRMLPSISYTTFNDQINKYNDEFADMVNDFVVIYPSLITAQAMALGDMFNRDDYPSAESMAQKFAFRVSYMPVPTAGDFRVDVGNAAQEELRQQMEKLSNERIEKAMGDVRSRLKTHLDRMMAQMQEFAPNAKTTCADGSPRAPKISNSLIQGGIELCDLLQSLNLTGDKDIEGARMKLRNLLETVDIKDLKKFPDARLDVREKVADIMDKFNF